MRRCHVGIASGLILATLAGGAFAADVAVKPQVPLAQLPTEDAPRMMISKPPRVDYALASISDVIELADFSGVAFDGVVKSAEVFVPAGMKIPVTRYTFEVTEWIKGEVATREVTLNSVGTMDSTGTGVYTCQSVKLTPGNRYMVFTKPNSDSTNLPFMRVFQVHNNGALVADERGNVFVGINGTEPMFRKAQNVNSLMYSDAPKSAGIAAGGPINLEQMQEVFEDADNAVASQGAKPVSELLAVLRLAAAERATPAMGATFALSGTAPAASGPTTYGPRYVGTKWHTGSINQYLYIPDDDNYNWWAASVNDWNSLAQPQASGSDFLIGWFSGAGRANLPTAGDSRNNCGVLTSAQMVTGGYGSWAANGDPNGICFNWTSGNVIVEVDAFMNSINTNDELQFRKSMVHELGHGLRLGHEDRYVAVLVSGTWRMPPNYVLGSYYSRGDDLRGVRDMIDDANADNAGTFLRENWGDMATFSQSHPDWGTSGDVRFNMTGLNDYTLTQGQAFNVNNMFVENRGTTAVTGAEIKWYLSSNTTISTADYEVGSGSWASFAGNSYWNDGDFNLSIGHDIVPGTYYLGWILSGMNVDEFTNNNVGIMLNNSDSNFSPRTVTVNCDTSTIAPASVTATNGTYCEKVRVTYSAVANATGYEIYRSSINSTGFASKIADDAASPYDDFTANPRVTYYYWVKAKTNCDVSPFSASNSGNINPVDYNGDGFLTFEDFDDFVTDFEAGKATTDFNGDGFLTFEDFDAFVVAFQKGC